MEYPKNIYMSPRIAIQRFCQIMQRCHPETIHTGNNYREEKEALIAAQVTYGIEQKFGGQHYLQNGEHIAKDIDIKIVERIPDTNYNFKDYASLQITEFGSNSENFIDVFKNKQKKGYKLDELVLVISVRDKEGWIFQAEDLSRGIKQIGSIYKTVWLILEDKNEQWDYYLIELYPDFEQIKFNVQDSFNNAEPPDFVRQLPKYGKYIEAEKEYVLALPSCPVCGAV